MTSLPEDAKLLPVFCANFAHPYGFKVSAQNALHLQIQLLHSRSYYCEEDVRYYDYSVVLCRMAVVQTKQIFACYHVSFVIFGYVDIGIISFILFGSELVAIELFSPFFIFTFSFLFFLFDLDPTIRSGTSLFLCGRASSSSSEAPCPQHLRIKHGIIVRAASVE